MNNLPTVQKEIDFDFPLVKFSKDKKDWWCIRDAFQGVQIFGGIGSGKTSGSGKTIAKSFLKNGFGGLVMCAKKGEAVEWLEYAFSTNRWEDVIVFGKKNKFEIWTEYLSNKNHFEALKNFNNKYDWSKGNDKRFNPLQYEMNREGEGAGEVFNLSNLFMEIYKMGVRFSGGGSTGSSDRYWDNALKRCLNRIIELLKLSGETLSVENMRRIISEALNEEEVDLIAEKTLEEMEKWGEKNYCIYCILRAGENLEDDDEEGEYNYTLVTNYFIREYAKLEEKSKSIIRESFLGLAEPFLSGILKKYFSAGTNLSPEITFEGKIIILDFSVKEYLQAGVYAQGIFKLLWQQATERREVNEKTVPVFLWVDEAQLFLSGYDQIFQTTARSSKACTVFISQNISNYYVSIGGQSPQAKVDSLLGNLSTKIFHANNDTVTNEWGAKTISKAFRHVESISVGKGDSVGLSQQFHWQVEPREFTTLKSGGEHNEFKVQGIVTIAGRTWSNGRNFIKKSFNQKL